MHIAINGYSSEDKSIGDTDSSSPEIQFPPLTDFKVPNIPPAAYYIPDFITVEEEEFILRKLAESPQPKWKTVPSGRRLQYWGGTTSKNGTLLPEPLPEWLTSFPDIIRRIDNYLDTASNTAFNGAKPVLGINQVLVNEYAPGQGISPHEDGPAFRPLVATLSLGSHTVLDIHQYLSQSSPSPPMVATVQDTAALPGTEGRPIAAIPLAHLLLMPRSLLVLSSSLYVSHLHGISANTRDTIVLDVEKAKEGDVVVANKNLIGDSEVIDRLTEEGRWSKDRETRTSLTFRRAEKVLKGGAFAMAMGGLRRG